MEELEAPSANTPESPGGGSSSPPPSPSPVSWVQPATGAVVLLVVVARLVPLLDRFASEALKVDHCGWERWIPTLVVGALILGAVAPTAYRDLAGVMTAVKGLLPGSGKK